MAIDPWLGEGGQNPGSGRPRYLSGSSFWLLILLLLMAPGCRTATINKAQFQRLRLGMSPREVEEILGKGTPVGAEQVKELLQSVLNPPPAEGEPTATPVAPPFELSEMRGVRYGSEKRNIVVIYREDRLFRAFPNGL